MKWLLIGGGVVVFSIILAVACNLSKRDKPAPVVQAGPLNVATAVAGQVPRQASGKASWDGRPVPKPEWCFQPAIWENRPDPILARVGVPACVGQSNIIYLGIWDAPRCVGSAQAEVKNRVILHPATALPDARYWTRCAL